MADKIENGDPIDASLTLVNAETGETVIDISSSSYTNLIAAMPTTTIADVVIVSKGDFTLSGDDIVFTAGATGDIED